MTRRGWHSLICGLALMAVLPGCRAQHLRDSGISAFQVGRTDEARVLLKQSLDLEPSDGETLYYMGRAMQADGFYEQAIFYYQSCLQVEPGHKAAQKWLAKAMEALGPTGRPRVQQQ